MVVALATLDQVSLVPAKPGEEALPVQLGDLGNLGLARFLEVVLAVPGRVSLALARLEEADLPER
jgi:hypothetical protein